MRLLLVMAIGCSRPQPPALLVDAAVVDTRVEKPEAPANVTLSDACDKHEDCVAIELFVEGPLRCCIACGAQAAASKESGDAFIAMCAHERATRECPVYNCKAEVLDPKCVGGHCQLAPRPR